MGCPFSEQPNQGSALEPAPSQTVSQAAHRDSLVIPLLHPRWRCPRTWPAPALGLSRDHNQPLSVLPLAPGPQTPGPLPGTQDPDVWLPPLHMGPPMPGPFPGTLDPRRPAPFLVPGAPDARPLPWHPGCRHQCPHSTLPPSSTPPHHDPLYSSAESPRQQAGLATWGIFWGDAQSEGCWY